jgi:GGDEF domain-containing protein
MAITDALTQVYCRRYFFERFSEELERSKKMSRISVVL